MYTLLGTLREQKIQQPLAKGFIENNTLEWAMYRILNVIEREVEHQAVIKEWYILLLMAMRVRTGKGMEGPSQAKFPKLPLLMHLFGLQNLPL